MFIDEAIIHVKAGDGGNGAISFRREKFVPFGGPDGGDGGRGGSIYLIADRSVNTLLEFRFKRRFRGQSGSNGAGANKHGKKGKDLYIRVPPGTQIWEVEPGGDAAGGKLTADLVDAGQTAKVAQGGRGGLGNSHFATATNQTPRIAQKGEPGEEKQLRVELKLLADVGLVGYPNVGKSTFLAAVSRARPKIANYPFTTLEPNLGVASVGDYSFVVADIPGLIEGAHAGVGLGHEFLRHVERTRVLIHVIAGDSADPLDDYRKVNEELAQHNPDLPGRPQLIALNKLDIPEVRDRLGELRQRLGAADRPVYPISAATGEGVSELLAAAAQILQETTPEAPEAAPAEVVLRPHPFRERVVVGREGKVWVVKGRLIERAAVMTDFGNPEAARFFRRRLARAGVNDALARAGAQPGDTVRFGQVDWTWQP